MSAITSMLERLRNGDQKVRSQLVDLVYPELRRLAHHYMRGERPGHTFHASDVAHEVYMRMFRSETIDWQNRAHFFALAAQQMRHILVDHARARRTKKRGGNVINIPLEGAYAIGSMQDANLVALDEALTHLEALDSLASRVVELRFFGGMTEKETGVALGISVSTVKRKWEFARVWLFDQLNRPSSLPQE